MRLSTSTNILDLYPDQEQKMRHLALHESLKICAESGFRIFDMNFCDNGLPSGFLMRDDWEKSTASLRDCAESLGIEFSQSHLEFYNFCDPKTHDPERRERLVSRGIVASHMLGAKWAVLHPGTVYENGAYERTKSLEANREYLLPHLETAAKLGLGLAIENLPDKAQRRFGGAPSELLELLERCDCPNLGVCWDFGHGHLMKIDQAAWVRKLGSRIKAVHIADNHGEWDEHLAPFYGTIDWTEMLKALRSIDFPYDFTFEIHNATLNFPLELRRTQLKHLYEIGCFLLGIEG